MEEQGTIRIANFIFGESDSRPEFGVGQVGAAKRVGMMLKAIMRSAADARTKG